LHKYIHGEAQEQLTSLQNGIPFYALIYIYSFLALSSTSWVFVPQFRMKEQDSFCKDANTRLAQLLTAVEQKKTEDLYIK
jgi:hypothetical protein